MINTPDHESEIFRTAQKNSKRKQHCPPSTGAARKQRGTPEQISFAGVFKRAREDAEIKAQHGPVRILWKDGKPVTNS